MNIKQLTSTFISLLLLLLPLRASIGNTPEACEELYGKPTAVILKGPLALCEYRPKELARFEDPSETIIQVTFHQGQVVMMRFIFRGTKSLTSMQTALISTLNCPDPKMQYKIVGKPAADGTRNFILEDESITLALKSVKAKDKVVTMLRFTDVKAYNNALEHCRKLEAKPQPKP